MRKHPRVAERSVNSKREELFDNTQGRAIREYWIRAGLPGTNVRPGAFDPQLQKRYSNCDGGLASSCLRMPGEKRGERGGTK